MLRVLSHSEEEKWQIFKNVFVVKSEMLIVDEWIGGVKPISLPKRREWRRRGILHKIDSCHFSLD